jgi:septal ring factor EnvC (AmiA/AmiB activator)
MGTSLKTSSKAAWYSLLKTSQFLTLARFLFTLFLQVSLAPAAPQLEPQQESSDTSEKELSTFRINIRRLQQGISRQESKISETEAKERNILAELEVLDKKLAYQQDKLEKLQSNMVQQRALIDREEKALARIHSERIIVEKHLQKRITAYYTMGDIGIFNVTFSTKTLPELLSFQNSFDTLIKYDQDVIKVYKVTIRGLERANTALDLEKTVLEDFIHQTVQEKEMLETTKNEKSSLLTHIRTQGKLHEQAALEMQQAAKGLAEAIVALKNKNHASERGFLTNKGSLPPPVDGMLVTQYLQTKTNKLGVSRKSQGIELQAPNDTKITAVSAGVVVFSGYLRGYGNTVIIHHGFQYYSVTSRIEKLLVAKGQKVKIEESIGVMGDTATLFEDGLYFELRHNRQSLDPLLWLNPNRLSTLQGNPADHTGLDSTVH